MNIHEMKLTRRELFALILSGSFSVGVQVKGALDLAGVGKRNPDSNTSEEELDSEANSALARFAAGTVFTASVIGLGIYANNNQIKKDASLQTNTTSPIEQLDSSLPMESHQQDQTS
jgi:hypothetical protein